MTYRAMVTLVALNAVSLALKILGWLFAVNPKIALMAIGSMAFGVSTWLAWSTWSDRKLKKSS
jgi:hypothetical protein